MAAVAQIRPSAVAGYFYPDDARELRQAVDGYLAAAATPATTSWPKAIIAPHAGYVYSGPVAATAYARLVPARGTVRRVVLLGPSHRVAFQGIAAPSSRAFATPLGDIEIDQEALTAIAALPGVGVLDEAHAMEHSLEVHLPFLQAVLGDFKLVPLVVGDAGPDAVSGVLDALWGGPETVVVISSDLSHYHDYATAQAKDQATTEAIEAGNIDLITSDRACGGRPIKGLMAFGKKRNLTFSLVDLRNSGDTAGSRDKVVGYASFLVREPGDEASQAQSDEFDEGLRRIMISVADSAIRHGLETGKQISISVDDWPAALASQRATFVTVELDGRLRGCIGSLAAHQPLIADLAANAYAAAFKDPRFKPLQREEYDRISLKISILSEPREISFTSEADLVAQFRPGVDGLILSDQGRRGTFLPQVWEQIPDVQDFWRHLKGKAGFKPDHWSDSVRVWRYTTETFTQPDD